MKHVARLGAAGALSALLLTGCTLVAGESADDEPGAEASGSAGAEPTEVVLLAHESFNLSKQLRKRFRETTGYRLTVRAAGDAGALVNKLVLTEGSPTGDVAFGIDNTYGSRAVDSAVLAEHEVELPPGVDAYNLPGGEDVLVPVDNGNVCVNIDTGWFADRDIKPPKHFEDLVDKPYKGLFVTPAATTSSPGMAFLLATIAHFGEAEGEGGEGGWQGYWEELTENGTKITAGWSDAYYVDFTLGGEGGKRPIVLSYDSSPAFTLNDDGTESLSKALDGCYQQVEYAGLLEGAANPEGGRALLEFLLSPEVQESLPESMYVFPVRDDVELPPDWAKFAVQPTEPLSVDPADITENRERWLREWTDITSR